MSQTQEKKTPQPATTRSEELLGRMGRGLGVFAASTSQRVQHAATTVREKAEQRSQSVAAHAEKANPDRSRESNETTMERADELVDQMETRIGHITSLVSFNVQRATARLREEAEDMWAEAQHIRKQNHSKP